MKAMFVIGPGKSELRDIPIPEIGDEDVLVKMCYCGVCASELHVWSEGPQDEDHKRLGHEGMGIIEHVGSRVTGWQPGDRVTGCMSHAYAEYVRMPAWRLVRVPDNIPDHLAFTEPLSCLMSGAERTPVALGDSVAVIGLGFMGLGMLQLLKLKGAARIIGVGIRPEELETARYFGANEVYLPDEVPVEYIQDGRDSIEDNLEKGIPVVVEASGTASALDLGGRMVKAHGVLSLVGYHHLPSGIRSIPMDLWNCKAFAMINAQERRGEAHVMYQNAVLKLISEDRFNMKDMVTHIFPLEALDEANTALRDKPKGFIKAVMKIS